MSSYMGLFLPRCRTLHFSFLNKRYVSVHFSSLPRSLRMAAHISFSSQFYISYKPAEGTLCPNVQVINEDIQQCWAQYWPLGYTTIDSSPAGFCDTDHKQPFEHGSLAGFQSTRLPFYLVCTSFYFIYFFMGMLWHAVIKTILKLR